MAPRRKTLQFGPKTGDNRPRPRPGFIESLRLARARALKMCDNKPSGKVASKCKYDVIAEICPADDSPHLLLQALRWMLGFALAPLPVITSLTFFSLFSASVDHRFWTSAPFWYFATGAILMISWFATGIGRRGFLYLYVLGHELTHILFIWLFRGKIHAWDATPEGGFVATDKSNILIALAPYFVPLWASLGVVIYAAFGLFIDLSPAVLKSLYAFLGFSWAFHLLWTLWMIPRDQPDLRENGTFLSLIIIYFANLLLLVGLTCLASPDMSFRGFAVEWLRNARETAEVTHALVLRAMR